ncbi:MAG TPA: carboxypeptidase-like regulatory domain-containing protein [Terriglobales bacterium]|nr:carboxypeptidase-like regulatory domain-containing protein [Terriglobales bacterium]
MKLANVMRISILIVVALLLVCGLQAQTAGTGALGGRVKDSTGAFVAGATVTLTNVATGQTRTVITGQEGLYTFPLLLPGQYNLAIEAPGFKKLVESSITINVTDNSTLDASLQVGVASESVTVTGGAEAIQTTTSTVGTLLSSEQVVDLPLSTRNYTNLLALSSGASAAVNNASNLGKGAEIISVNGASEFQNNYQMDGASVNNSTTNSTLETGANGSFGIPNPDSIQEFKIQTSTYDASYGRNSGANVNLVTKSGTNEFHGSAFEFFRNTALDANDFFNKNSQLKQGQPNKQQVLNQHQFGGVFGGPIVKDKLFFFVSYQETRQKNAASPFGFQTGVLLPAIPQGDRSTPEFVQALGAAFAGQIPMTGLFGGFGVAADGSNINPVALNILNLKLANGNYYIPSPTVSGPVSFGIPAIFKEHQGMGNWDYVLSPKHTLAGRYFYVSAPTFAPFPGGLGFPAPDVPGNPVSWNFGSHVASLKLTSAMTSNFVNEVRASYQRYSVLNTNDIPFKASQVGITPVQADLDGLPNIWFLPIDPLANPTSMDIGSHPFFGNIAGINQYQFADQVSWTRGKHTVRFGAEMERDQWNWVFNSLAEGATMIFPSFSDFLLGLPAFANGAPVGNIINIPNFATRGPVGGLNKNYRQNYDAWFVQDDIKLASRLTLNAGLRWEYFGGIYDAHGRFSSLWLNRIPGADQMPDSPDTATFVGYVVPKNYSGPAIPDGVLRAGTNSTVMGDMPRDNFAPRIGFSWQPVSSNKLAVRGGFGYFFDRIAITTPAESAEQSIPFGYTIPFNWFGSTASLAVPFGTTPTGWNQGLWVNPANLGNPFLQISSNIQQNAVMPNLVVPTSYAWNLNAQYEFLPKWVLEIGYAGSRGVHQFTNNKLPINPARMASDDNPIEGQTTNPAANAALRVPYLGVSPLTTGSDSSGDFKYQSFQATVRKQVSHGLQLQSNYTYTHALSTGGGSNEDVVNWSPTDYRLHYGPNYFYRPHRFTVSYVYDFPYSDRGGFKGKALGGWSLSGVTVIQSGHPMTIVDSNGATSYFGATGAVVKANAQYASGKGAGDVKASGDLTHLVIDGLNGGSGYINADAVTTVPYVGTPGDSSTYGTLWGNSGFGILLSPGQQNWDMSLAKTTKVGGFNEHANLIFRTEFFNIFNHTQFGDPNNDVSSGTLGHITNASVNPRLVQFALKYQF